MRDGETYIKQIPIINQLINSTDKNKIINYGLPNNGETNRRDINAATKFKNEI